jgi:dTDP-4-amino-4,6-dideoxygalactose transaminase
MQTIEMLDLKPEYEKIKTQLDKAVIEVVRSGKYINGKPVREFITNLQNYTGAKYVVPCANGTDAIKLALLALNLKEGDEVIIPNFTFIAAAEMVALLKLVPVVVDVRYDTFNIDVEKMANAITNKTKAVIPVHLFGQACQMSQILEIARKHNLHVIEDNAQSIGATYRLQTGQTGQTGTMGDIGTFSFFPSKNLGCLGDGGAITTNNQKLATTLKMLTQHGQTVKYKHQIVGCNSRLDNIQAAVLNVKLPYLDANIKARQNAAKMYDMYFQNSKDILETPQTDPNASHVFNQYTIKVPNGKRNELQNYFAEKGIQTMVYYPIPIHRQKAFRTIIKQGSDLAASEKLCRSVISLPIHPNLTEKQIEYIAGKITSLRSVL